MFGYRPAFILSGSMEPTILTNAIVLAKSVGAEDTLQNGDIVSFTVQDESGQKVRISHRIIEITDDGTIVTKGDNNNHADEYPLTRADIQYKIIGIWNGFAVIVRFLNSKYGIPSLIGFTLAVCLFYYAAKCLIVKESDESDGNDDVIEVELVEDGNEIVERKG